MLSLFMWDMKVEITAGRMHNSLTQFMHFFCKKATFIPERITKESSLSFEWTLYSLPYMFGINGRGSEFSTVVCRVPKAEGCKVPPPPKKSPFRPRLTLTCLPLSLFLADILCCMKNESRRIDLWKTFFKAKILVSTSFLIVKCFQK